MRLFILLFAVLVLIAWNSFPKQETQRVEVLYYGNTQVDTFKVFTKIQFESSCLNIIEDSFICDIKSFRKLD